MQTSFPAKNSGSPRLVLTAAAFFGAALALTAAEATLTNRTSGFTREMSTDRPDMTESPYTVEAGHWQVEMDLVNYSHDRYNPARADVRVDSYSVGTVNLKYGLCPRSDVQLVIPTYNHVRTHDRTTGAVTENSGFGDLLLRGKLNLWGNDGGKTAFGVMPFVKMPSNQDGLGNKAWEGGLILPLAVELPAGWGMGVMSEFDFIEDAGGSGYHPEFFNTITFSHDIVGKLAGYVEFTSLVSTESGSTWAGTVNGGLTYALTDDIQLDGGVNFGVTRAAEDINPFLGVSFRF